MNGQKKDEKRFSVRLTDKSLIKFVDKQSNLNDTIVFLLQKELYIYGDRDLQNEVPSKREREFFDKFKYEVVKK